MKNVEFMNLRLFGLSEKRRAEAARIREKYPDRIPVRFSLASSFLLSICL